jgi:hypothetical protein
MFGLRSTILRVAVCIALATTALLQESASPVAADGGALKAAGVLDQSKWQKAEAWLPPEILNHYREGEYANRVVPWAPFTSVLGKHPFYVIDAVPRYRYYTFGSLDLYIDNETFPGVRDSAYRARGELLNAYQAVDVTSPTSTSARMLRRPIFVAKP